jgi:putative Holliday junction resolvase
MKGKLLGLDIGAKRTGIAETDMMQIIASPLETVESTQLLAYLKRFIENQQVAGFVIGKALDLKGDAAESAVFIEQMTANIAITFPEVPIYRLDERFTSKLAMRSMIAGGASKKQRREKGNLDKISAAIILQDFINSL